jgi:GTP-binding protein HflX
LSREATQTARPKERVLVCGVVFPDFPEESGGPLSEARALVRAAEGDVVGEGIVQRRDRPEPATMMGKGKVEEIADEAARLRPDAVVVDNDLSPAQVRNLEKAWKLRVIDRSELILDIFSRRAQTRQARLQVELAQNEYLVPRLRRMWTHLERTEGAIGTRGPGETQLETDKRLLSKRITDLKRELATIEERKQREVRTRDAEFTIGLVGYTNAGKSTLLNRLTGASEFVADMPFATLDTRTRRWVLPDRRTALLSDTVGFLQRLPHHLVASFHATLEETLNADLLLHVVDASHPDALQQMRAVDGVLAELSPHLEVNALVLNKVDRVLDPLGLHLLVEGRREEVIHVSAVTGEGIDRLTAFVTSALDRRSQPVAVHIPPGDGRSIAAVRSAGAVDDEQVDDDGTMHIRLRLSAGALGLLRRQLGPGATYELLAVAPSAAATPPIAAPSAE